jgi:hypothetical protein
MGKLSTTRESKMKILAGVTGPPHSYSTFPMRIALIDHFGRSHASLIEVQVDRTMRMPDFSRKGTALYGPSRASKVANVPEDMRRHPRQPASSTRRHATRPIQASCFSTEEIVQGLAFEQRRNRQTSDRPLPEFKSELVILLLMRVQTSLGTPRGEVTEVFGRWSLLS